MQSTCIIPGNILKGLYYRDDFTFLLIAALVTATKKWNQPRCPSTEEDRKKIEFYSTIKKNET